MSGSGQRVLKHLTEVQSCSARCNTHPNSVIAELETADSPEMTVLPANGPLTVQVSTPRSPLWPLALSFRRLDRLSQDPTADLGIRMATVYFCTGIPF